jgi:hypothetical protein
MSMMVVMKGADTIAGSSLSWRNKKGRPTPVRAAMMEILIMVRLTTMDTGKSRPSRKAQPKTTSPRLTFSID